MSKAEADLLARLHALKPSAITSLDPRQPVVVEPRQSGGDTDSDGLAETKPARDADELLARFQRFRQATPSRSALVASNDKQQQQTEEARDEDLEQAPARTADELLSRFQRLHGRLTNDSGSDVVVVGRDDSVTADKPPAPEADKVETTDDLSELSKDDATEDEDDWEMILAEHKQQMHHDGDDAANVKGLMREADAALRLAAAEQGAIKGTSGAEQDDLPSAKSKTSVTKSAAKQDVKTVKAGGFDSDARELDFTDIGRAVDSHQTVGEKASTPSGPTEDDEATAYIREALEKASLNKDGHASAADDLEHGVSDDETGGGDAFALPSAPTAAPVASSSKFTDEPMLPSAPSFAPSARVGTVQKPRLGSDKDNDDKADVDSWCIICQDDATLQCLGCDSDLYCMRCWNEGHRGEGAGYEERRHRAVHYEKDGGGKETKGKPQRRKMAA